MLSRKRKVRADDRVGVGDDQLLQVGLGSRVGIVSDVCVQQEQGQEQLHQQQDVVAGVEVGGASGVGVHQQQDVGVEVGGASGVGGQQLAEGVEGEGEGGEVGGASGGQQVEWAKAMPHTKRTAAKNKFALLASKQKAAGKGLLSVNQICDLLEDDEGDSDDGVQPAPVDIIMIPPNETGDQDSAGDSDDSDQPTMRISAFNKQLLEAEAELNIREDEDDSEDEDPQPGNNVQGDGGNNNEDPQPGNNVQGDGGNTIEDPQPGTSSNRNPRSVGRRSVSRSVGRRKVPLRVYQQQEEDDEESEDEDDSEEEEDEEEEESNPEANKIPKKKGKTKNPEYNRQWYSRDQGVGSRIADFDPTPNEFLSQQVQGIQTPEDAFRLFLPDSFVQYSVEESKKYGISKGMQHKAAKVNEDTFLCSVGVILLSGYNRLPSRRMYWEQSPDTYSQIVSKNIRRDELEDVLYCTHFIDNGAVDQNVDRMKKVRPLFDILNQQADKYLPKMEHLSVDEIVIPYFGHHPDKQFLRAKPHRFGYKVWAICDSQGFIRWVEPYCGRHTQIEDYGMGQGPNVVAGLVVKGVIDPGSLIYFDNLFTSIPLLNWLSERGIGGTGTMRQNRITAIPIESKKKLEKSLERGASQQMFTDDISLVAWKDNRVVYLASNCHAGDTSGTVRRWSRDQKEILQVPQPKSVGNYNTYMGGVDLLDQQTAVYASNIRKKKWWWAIWTWSLHVMTVNAWRLFNIVQERNNARPRRMSLLEFQRQVVMELLTRHGSPRAKFGPTIKISGPANKALRFDGLNHWPTKTEIKGVCGHCKYRTQFRCSKCNVAIHPDCFRSYHI